MADRLKVEIYFDYACPFVNAAAKWIQDLNNQLGDDWINFEWRFFPLEQVNAPADTLDTVWDLPPENRSQARNSMHAALAAMKQGQDAFQLFNLALLALKHDEGQDHGRRATLEEAARRADLDLELFHADLEDRSLLTRIRDDYLHARSVHGVFGTPTFVFPGGESAYLQLLPAPPAADAIPLWQEFASNVQNRPYLREIKRTKRPQ